MRSAPLLAIVGPTCTGKSRLAVALAQRLDPAELINADSRQLRRGLPAGTCAPTAAELQGVACHLLEQAEPGADYTVADWLTAATAAVDAMGRRGVRPILVGGTGLYISAIVDGYDFGGAAPDRARRAGRTRLGATAEGRSQLVAELSRLDPEATAELDVHNPRRVIRALEILERRGGRLRAARGTAPRPAVLIGLDAPPDVHSAWIARRCAAMFRDGAIVAETRAALEHGHSATAISACGIGYAEALAVLEGGLDAEDAADLTAQRSIRYAKAQRRYFRRDARVRWLRADDEPGALLEQALSLAGAGDRAVVQRP